MTITAGTRTRSPLPPDVGRAVDLLARHADNPSAFLAMNTGTCWFGPPAVDGLIAYRPAGRRWLVQLGGPFAAAADQDRLLDQFLRFAARQGRRVAAVQLLRSDAERYADHGFVVNQLGASYARSLDGFSLRGGAHMQLRNKLSRARRAGVVVSEAEAGRAEDPALASIDRTWLRAKGRHVKELTFMVGERDGRGAPLRRLFVAAAAGVPLAYVSFSPVYGRHPGWLHDLSRRRPDAPPGTMELVVATAVELFRAEGAAYLHFGFTPFTSLSDDHEIGGHNPLTTRLVRLLAAHGRHVYPAADQLAYKLKWAPDLVQPEYVAFAGGGTVGGIWSLLRLTHAI